MAENKVTFSDIAKYTCFSKTTISRYFNNPESVTLENQAKIETALKELNYKKNKIAKILASGHSECIGIIMPTLFYDDYHSAMLNQLLSTYPDYGYKFMVFTGHGDIQTERKYIQELLAYKVEGLIVLSHTMPSEELAGYSIPVVGIEREDRHIHSVRSGNYPGACLATELLIQNHCEKLFFIGRDLPATIPSHRRMEAFEDTCDRYQVSHKMYLHKAVNSYEENRDIIMKNFLDIEKNYPKEKLGIFVENDTQAHILLNIILRKYGKLPKRFRIIGFDDSPISRESVIPTSTVGQQIDVIAKTALDILVAEIAERKKRRPNPSAELIHQIITPILHNRETTD
ncbi:MAG: LacI family transcriptional regulator [Lachnospiraceae bacterium]|nr:LacI family transcriptional regulator [Lachnospiraceae bacterium]